MVSETILRGQVQWGGNDFRQLQPDAGAAPSAQTVFKILYDAKLVRTRTFFDPDPSKIVRRMSRRDGFDGDFIEINIDSYYDKRTAFSFTASVSGVKGDEYVSKQRKWLGRELGSDLVSRYKHRQSGLAVAEFRIPLSQLRFADKPGTCLGHPVYPDIFSETRNVRTGSSSPHGKRMGIHVWWTAWDKGIRAAKQLEIQPYVVAKTERFEPEKGNPFMTGKSSDVAVGLDAKIGITSDITPRLNR